ncbi:energy transducer TonB [Hymenobacter tenuis]
MTAAAHTSLPSLDDIVFEGRNKAYGAYVLRKVYGRHIITAVLISTSLAAFLIAVPLAMQQFWPSVVEAAPLVDLGDESVIKLEDVRFEQPKPATAAASAVAPVPRPATPLKIVPDDQVKATPPSTAPETTVDGPSMEGPVAAGDMEVGVGGGSSHDTVELPAAPAVNQPFVHVEVMPEFAGGVAALTKYLQRQLHYPPQALKAGVEGKVYISFTVNADGSITDVDVLKGLGYGTDEEASRVIRQMPAWKPGYQNNHPVRVRYTLPITFQYE